MTLTYAKHYSKKGPTPQSEPMLGRESEQAKNNAGGFAFTVNDWARLDRFLILGSEGGTYYVGERKLTRQNANTIVGLIQTDGPRVVARVVEISDEGRAPKNDPALFVLALAASSDDMKTRQLALQALPKVARIGTHLFHFAEFVNSQRGWGRALKRAVGDWYTKRDAKNLINQVIKYQGRDGWSNRDLLRLSKPKTDDAGINATLRWSVGKDVSDNEALSPVIRAFEALKKTPTVEIAVAAIENHGLPRECVPTELLNDPKVWKALLLNMPLNAMTRNLAKMTAIDVLKPLSAESVRVIEALGSEEAIKKSRLHPLELLKALKVYGSGRGEKGSLTWKPNQNICDALDGAFYKAFKTVEPTGKRIMLALDISGSMGGASINGMSMTAREASGAMALVTAAVEKNTYIVGFTGGNGRYDYWNSRGKLDPDALTPLDISPKMRMDRVIQNISGLPMGSTDCALPMVHALKNKLEVDAFVVYTDNETWAGSVHPSEALKDYRKKTGIAAKLIVVGMTSTEFTIADPKDPGMMDVVGFDTAAPQIIADFIRA